MDWMEEVRENLKKRRQILFSKDAVCLQPLAAQLAQQPHTVLVLWALAWAEETVDTLEARYPQERRPREALEAARAWAAGALKMRPAQRAILNCHALAKELGYDAGFGAGTYADDVATFCSKELVRRLGK